jgi:hypothetical protein
VTVNEFRVCFLFVPVAIALVSPAGRRSRAARRGGAPAVACKTPEANEAARLTRQRARGLAMLLDYLDRHASEPTGETVTIVKSGTFEGGRFVQPAAARTSRQDRRGPPIYWTYRAIGQ